jgi:hypothetical protein
MHVFVKKTKTVGLIKNVIPVSSYHTGKAPINMVV